MSEMQETPVLYRVEQGVARITLNRPDRLNAFNQAMHSAMAAVLDDIEARDDIRLVVLTGAGKGFCAGQDLRERAGTITTETPDLGAGLEQRYNPFIRRLRALPMPLVVAVNGTAAGAGASLVMLADIAIARESASFTLAFVRIGLMPDCGATWTLQRLIGPARAAALALTGNSFGAREAAEMGMIWRAVPDDAFDQAVTDLITHLAALPPLALREIKQSMAQAWGQDFNAQLDRERDGQRRLGRTADYVEGVQAFVEKRKPRYQGR